MNSGKHEQVHKNLRLIFPFYRINARLSQLYLWSKGSPQGAGVLWLQGTGTPLQSTFWPQSALHSTVWLVKSSPTLSSGYFQNHQRTLTGYENVIWFNYYFLWSMQDERQGGLRAPHWTTADTDLYNMTSSRDSMTRGKLRQDRQTTI